MSTAVPYVKMLRWYYRGPDIPGTALWHAVESAINQMQMECYSDLSPPLEDTFTFPALTVKVVEYDAAAIHTVADLAALDPLHLPARKGTLATYTINGLGTTLNLGPWRRRLAIPESEPTMLDAFAGPQLVGLELPSGADAPQWAFEGYKNMAHWCELLHALDVESGTRNLEVRAL